MREGVVYQILLVGDPGRAGERRAVLEEAGFRVLTAAAGRAGLEAARRDLPDLALSDVTLPDMDGVELCRLVRAEAELSLMPFLLHGASGEDPEGALRGLREGADDYLEAHVTPALLVAKVTRHAVRGLAMRERGEAERRLRYESEMLRALMDNIPDAIYFKDTEGRFTRANRRVPYRGRVAAEEVTGKTDFDFFEPEHARAARDDEERIIRTGRPILAAEEKEVYPDGSTTWLSTTKVPIFGEGGRVTGIVGISRDITEGKRAEEALSRSEAYYRSLIENTNDLISLLNPEGVVLYESPSCSRILGYAPEELAGRRVFDLVHPEDVGPLSALFAEALAREELTEPIAYRFRHKDGSWLVLESVGKSMKDPASGEAMAVVNTRDVTERRRLEDERARLLDEVARQRQRLDSLIANVPGVVWESWVEPGAGGQRVNFVSEQVEALHGYSREEWLSTPDFWLKTIHPDDREAARAKSEEMLAGGAGGVNQYRVTTRTGGLIWVETHMRVVREGGQVLGVRGITIDVTERKLAEEAVRESEARLFRLLDALPVGVFVITPDGGPYYVNRAAGEILGRGVAAGVKAEGLGEAYSARIAGTREPYPAARMPVVRALAGEYATADDMEIVRGGEAVPLRIWAAPVYGRSGDVAFAVAAFSDISEQRRAEREMGRLIAELRSALDEVKSLRGILPICMYCKNIRCDENYWERVESYISKHSAAQFSHSICPDCYTKVVGPQLEGWKCGKGSPP